MAFLIEAGREGPRLVLTGPWTPEVERYMRQEQIRELYLNHERGWQGTHLSFLQNLPQLTAFGILDFTIQDIAGVRNLPHLRHLEVSTYDTTPLDFGHFPELRSCVFYWRDGSQSLFRCKSLEDLFIHRYPERTSAPFGQLVNLRRLSIANSEISEVTGLAPLHSLEFLGLYNLKRLTSLEGLQHLSSLEALEVNGCRSVGSITEVEALRGLRRLQLNDDGKIDSLSPVASNRELEEILFYESTNIVDGDLSPIAGLPRLRNVSFQNRRHYTHTREQLKRRQVRSGG